MDDAQPDIDFKPVVKLFTPDAQCTRFSGSMNLNITQFPSIVACNHQLIDIQSRGSRLKTRYIRDRSCVRQVSASR
jgi:hypothetical protein